MATVCLLGTMDTKGLEYGYLAQRIAAFGAGVTIVDAGVVGRPSIPVDVTAAEIAVAAGTTLETLRTANDRGAAITAMAAGAEAVVARLAADGRIDAILALGGSGGTTLTSQAMRALPVGFPKLLVSTVASGYTAPYVGAVDITMMHSVVDISGLNRVSMRILDNAAAAIVGMASAWADRIEPDVDRPLIAASMFGVTTPAVTTARTWLEAAGNEVLVFHATGTGGQSMEALIEGGFIAGVLDLTTTELADELIGGALSAGPRRLTVAGQCGVPQVVSLGALDMVNFGARDTVPPQFADRNLYVHNATVTLMRTTPEECTALGRRVAERLNHATGPTALFIPERGISAIATEGGVFYDPDADTALFDAVTASLREDIDVHRIDTDINDPAFATAMAERLQAMIAEGASL